MTNFSSSVPPAFQNVDESLNRIHRESERVIIETRVKAEKVFNEEQTRLANLGAQQTEQQRQENAAFARKKEAHDQTLKAHHREFQTQTTAHKQLLQEEDKSFYASLEVEKAKFQEQLRAREEAFEKKQKEQKLQNNFQAVQPPTLQPLSPPSAIESNYPVLLPSLPGLPPLPILPPLPSQKK